MNNTQEDLSLSCKLFDLFGISIQAFLLVFSLLVLIFKKQFEKKQRDWLTWCLDVSKLIFCQATQHILNLFISYKIGQSQGLECEWYIINILTDCTICVLLQWALFTILNNLLKSTKYAIHSGEYYINNVFCLSTYMYQIVTWIGIVIFGKFLSSSLFFIFGAFLKELSLWILKPVQNDPRLKLLVVMIGLPAILNSLQYWFTDSFIQKKENEEKEASTNNDEKDRLINNNF